MATVQEPPSRLDPASNSVMQPAVPLTKPTATSTQDRPQKKPPLGPKSAPSQMHPKHTTQVIQQQKVPRRSSKPIINWFQRKLAGSGKAKRTENVPLTAAGMGTVRNTSNRQINRITSSPLPVPAVQQLKQQNKPDAASLARRKTRSFSLNGDEELRDFNRQSYGPDSDMSDQSSLNRDSLWSPASALEADDDASVRPIPPSAPPSPSPSRSSSSYMSDPRTFRSIAASTKPTTLLSIDLNGGMAHIAQAPPPHAQLHRLVPHVRQSSSLSNPGLLSSAGSITFSALPNPQPSPSRPTSLRNPGSLGSLTAMAQSTAGNTMSSVQAPLHTSHHPRNNPRPSSPPLDNASMLTLASSAFGVPNRVGPQNYPPSAIGDSVSHYGGGSIVFADGESTSHYVLGDDDRLDERDFDASVRALRPRSSRRGSWESEASRWSARVHGPGTPSLARERSLWTSNSIRTGGLSVENGEAYETADDQTPDNATADIDSDKGSRSEINLNDVDVALEAMPTINVDEVKADDSSTSAASESTGVAEMESSHILRRISTDTIAQPTVGSDSPPPSTPSPKGKIDLPVVETAASAA